MAPHTKGFKGRYMSRDMKGAGLGSFIKKGFKKVKHAVSKAAVKATTRKDGKPSPMESFGMHVGKHLMSHGVKFLHKHASKFVAKHGRLPKTIGAAPPIPARAPKLPPRNKKSPGESQYYNASDGGYEKPVKNGMEYYNGPNKAHTYEKLQSPSGKDNGKSDYANTQRSPKGDYEYYTGGSEFSNSYSSPYYSDASSKYIKPKDTYAKSVAKRNKPGDYYNVGKNNRTEATTDAAPGPKVPPRSLYYNAYDGNSKV